MTLINPSDQTITQYNIQTGGANNLLNNVAPSATSGVPVISQGASAQPIFGTAVVAGGGTGVTSFANTSALLASGTTTTGNLQNIASVATGQVLVSAGTSTIPAWSASPTVTSITFGSGSALSSYIENTTFTPALAFGGGSTGITYNSQQGFYTRIGNLVFFRLIISLTNKGSSTGAATITGFPINANGLSQVTFIQTDSVTLDVPYTIAFMNMNSGATTANIFENATAVNFGTVSNTSFANNSVIRAQGFYTV